MPPRTLLLTGATGFVGRAVWPALVEAGWTVRGLTRDAERARRHAPDREWVQGDVADRAACERAMAGCGAALYLVHGMGEGADYHRREVEAAATFAQAAHAAGVARIVYLGGVAPRGEGSAHLRSRRDVGETLRAGPVPVLELRASMIVGDGSLSWLIVRDLAARLPVMVLPRWLRSRTEPVAIDDIVVALVRALDLPPGSEGVYDVPGPEVLSGREILEKTSRVMGLARPHMLAVPLLTPRLSSLWVRFVTRAEWSVAREVVVGLTEDLLAEDARFWELIGHTTRLDFTQAARRALGAEAARGPVGGAWGAVERARGLAPGGCVSDGLSADAASIARAESMAVRRQAALAIACVVTWLGAVVAARPVGMWLAIGTASVLLGAATLAFDGPATRAVARPNAARVLLGAGIGVAMAAATHLLYPWFARFLPFVAEDTAALYAAFRAPSPTIAALAVLPVIVGEELVWRGVVHAALVRRFGPVVGLGACALVYGLVLLPLGAPTLAFVAMACGLAWGLLRAWTGSLVPPLVAHLVWNVVVLVAFPLAV
jgi:uncharacterized protein YbjT (DUF2867 family)/membrane protease YdiL (CAAX protease family)